MIQTGKIGAGVYGTVHQTTWCGCPTAIKRNLISKKSNFFGSIRELDILARLAKHPYIVLLKGIVETNPFSNRLPPIKGNAYREDPLFFAFDLADMDLYRYLRTKAPNLYIRKNFILHLLLGLEWIHRCGIVHRDLKPENLLVFTSNGQIVVRICDFGLAMPYTANAKPPGEIVTPWYRAPEICLGSTNLSYPLDCWSAGCILYEIITGLPLLEEVGIKDRQLLQGIVNNVPIADSIFGVTRTLTPTWDAIPEFDSTPGSREQFLEVLTGLLQFDPARRWTASQALDAPFFDFGRTRINDLRQRFPEPIITIPPAPMIQIPVAILNWARTQKWYQPQIGFHAVDCYRQFRTALVEADSDLLFRVCLYLNVKYFDTFSSELGFKVVYPGATPAIIQSAFELEKIFIWKVSTPIGALYRPTPFELHRTIVTSLQLESELDRFCSNPN